MNIRMVLVAIMVLAVSPVAWSDTISYSAPAIDAASYSDGGVTVSGSANVYSPPGNWLGVKGGSWDDMVDYTGSEYLRFEFDTPATEVVLHLGAVVGYGTANVTVEGYDAMGSSYGQHDIDLVPYWTHLDVSGLFSGLPLGAFEIHPLRTNLYGTETRFSASSISFVPEPATVGMLAAGGLALLRRRRKQFRGQQVAHPTITYQLPA